MELIGSQNDPVVRHRLGAFWRRLCAIEEKLKEEPGAVAIEFVREDFMGKKALLDYRDFTRRRERERKQAREDAAKAGALEKSAALKMELLTLQSGYCLYTGESLVPTSLHEYEVDHIVPRTKGGPDAMVNYILTTRTANDQKSNQTPFEWLSNTPGWDAYVNRVKGRQMALGFKRARLLISPEAPELAEKYTALAETAWIAKLAQTLAGLHFGWRNGVDEKGAKRVRIISGGLTARIRRKYKLNSLLAGDHVSEEDAEKNRDDDRHHALDAMVLSFIPGWARDADKEKWFRFPEPVEANARGFLGGYLAQVQPENIHLSAARLEATAYGQRRLKRGKNDWEASYAVGREPLVSLLMKVTNGKEALRTLEKAETKRIVDGGIRREVEAFLAEHPGLTLDQWKLVC